MSVTAISNTPGKYGESLVAVGHIRPTVGPGSREWLFEVAIKNACREFFHFKSEDAYASGMPEAGRACVEAFLFSPHPRVLFSRGRTQASGMIASGFADRCPSTFRQMLL